MMLLTCFACPVYCRVGRPLLTSFTSIYSIIYYVVFVSYSSNLLSSVLYITSNVFSERELTFTFTMGYRPSVCLSSVCNVRAPYSGDWNFRNVSKPYGTLAICWHPGKILRRSSQGNPSVGGVKHNRGSRIQRFWTYRTLYLRNGAR